ncbi:MAG: ATP-binding cassette domain-containing protein, partial [Gemmatimonadaceae bacterium]
SAATPSSIARMMVGRDVVLAGDVMLAGDLALANNPPSGHSGDPIDDVAQAGADARSALGGGRTPSPPKPLLEVANLVVGKARHKRDVDGVSFTLRAGEIFGIAGVEGNGQTELIEALAGLRAVTSGSVSLNGADVVSFNVRERADSGLSHIPEDRQRRGLILDYTVADNLILGLQHRFSHRGVMQHERIRENADRQIAAFDIRPPQPARAARTLSGGNQQKIVIAREMGRDFSVLLASQPTRGVDVGAIEFIHAQLRAARDRGKAVLLVSADLVEVLALADRIAVMYEGRFVVTLPRGEATVDVLGPYMTGAQRTGVLPPDA